MSLDRSIVLEIVHVEFIIYIFFNGSLKNALSAPSARNDPTPSLSSFIISWTHLALGGFSFWVMFLTVLRVVQNGPLVSKIEAANDCVCACFS